MGKRNEELFEEAQKYMPGGVNSPVRAFRAVGGTPKFIKSAKGAILTDEDGASYIDYVCSWGPLILGHSNGIVTSALKEALPSGTSYGAPCEREVTLARLVCKCFPSIEMVRFVSSGTEAVMSAVRLARGYTRREKIIKFRGCYHGHADSFLVEAGSGLTTLGNPSSPGVTAGSAKDTVLCDYNDPEGVAKIFERVGKEIAAVIIEPVAGNMGLVLPAEGFLKSLRSLTSAYGSLLIFDEVISGFRVSKGGAQELYGIRPDLTALGKIIGGGLPVGAYGGSREIMSMVSPLGPVYQAGTLSGNPLAMTAGIETLKFLMEESPYGKLETLTAKLTDGIGEAIKAGGYPVSVERLASMFCIFFKNTNPRNWEEAKGCDTKAYAKFHAGLLNQGVYFPPAQFETCFVSTAHSEREIKKTVDAVKRVLHEVYAG